MSFRPSLRSKRSSSRWGRKREGAEWSEEEKAQEAARNAALAAAQEKRSPPPRLPELKALGVDVEDVKTEENGMLGGEDMFKHIK